MKKLTEEWIKKAEKDFLVAKRELNADPPEYDAVCFHSQQCVEKYMKAVLQENDTCFEKTHDLDILLERCKDIIPELMNFKRELLDLSAFAVEVRYPGVDATEDEAKESFEASKAIKTVVRTYFHLPL
ncbi:MAG: HEPN domain-containing protein [bacterium]